MTTQQIFDCESKEKIQYDLGPFICKFVFED